MAAGEWREVRLGDIVAIKHGWPFQSRLFCDDPSLPVVVAIGNFQYSGGFRFQSTATKHYSGEFPPSFILHPGDILLVMTCQTAGGEILGVPARVPGDGRVYLHNQRLGRVQILCEGVDPSFLYYLFVDSRFNRHLVQTASGSKILHTAPSRIEEFRFCLPPLPEQRAIARVLGALDDKIELNRQMNETLEQMARALFKSWFVDFDPVRAKAEGRQPEGIDPATAALFPSRLVDSPLGPIPEGWKAGVLEDVLAELETGGRPRGGVKGIESGVPSVGAESIVGLAKFDYSKTKYVPVEFFRSMRKGVVRDMDVLLYKDGGRPGEFEPHVSLFGKGFPFSEFAINEHVYRVRANSAFSQTLLYFWLSSESVKEEMRRKGTGVAIPGLNSSAVRSLTTLVPSRRVLERWNALVEPFVERCLSAARESRTLAQIRDQLLPKLISGEIRVPEVERQAAEVL